MVEVFKAQDVRRRFEHGTCWRVFHVPTDTVCEECGYVLPPVRYGEVLWSDSKTQVPLPLPPRPYREEICRTAAAELSLWLLEWGRRHNLSPAEKIYLVSDKLTSYASFILDIDRRLFVDPSAPQTAPGGSHHPPPPLPNQSGEGSEGETD